MTRFLALGCFDYSRHTLIAMANRGIQTHYGCTGKPAFLPEPRERLEVFRLPREDRPRLLAEAVDRIRPDAILVGTASYDGSNRVARELLALDRDVPIIRFYKEFVLRPSELERDVLCGVDGVVAGGHREALYFQSVYNVDPKRIHVFDPDVITEELLPDRRASKLSLLDGRPHVVLGGNLKADDSEFDYRELLPALADAGVHVHVYALGFSRWLAPGRALDPDSAEVREAYAPLWDHERIHLERPVFGAEQILEWSRYDAGLTQGTPGVYRPELTPVQHMNLPSKYSYYLAAGLPIAVAADSLPSLRRLLASENVLLEFDDVKDLATGLFDRERMSVRADAAERSAPRHTAEANLDPLLAFISGIVDSR